MATKHKTNTLETKYKAIWGVEKGLNTKTQIAKDFDEPLNTLSTQLKKADDYKKVYEIHGFGPPEQEDEEGRFKTTKGIGYNTIKGEVKDVKPEAMDAWKNTLLPKLLKDYSPDDIYNADETGLTSTA